MVSSIAKHKCHAASTMTWHDTQSHYTDTEPTRACPILIMLSTWLGSDKYKLLRLVESPDLPKHGIIRKMNLRTKNIKLTLGLPIVHQCCSLWSKANCASDTLSAFHNDVRLARMRGKMLSRLRRASIRGGTMFVTSLAGLGSCSAQLALALAELHAYPNTRQCLCTQCSTEVNSAG